MRQATIIQLMGIRLFNLLQCVSTLLLYAPTVSDCVLVLLTNTLNRMMPQRCTARVLVRFTICAVLILPPIIGLA